MRISKLQCAFVIFLTISLSGCYSGGKWTMPNLAFWKSSPFSSSTAGNLTPSTTTPTKPSTLATNNSTASLTTAPLYQGATSSTTTPGGAVAPQYSYPASTPSMSSATTAPTYTASQTSTVGNSQYVTPQQGPYGSVGTPSLSSSNSARSYTAVASRDSYSNPVRPPIQPSMDQSSAANDRYVSSSDRYGSSSDRLTSSGDITRN